MSAIFTLFALANLGMDLQVFSWGYLLLVEIAPALISEA